MSNKNLVLMLALFFSIQSYSATGVNGKVVKITIKNIYLIIDIGANYGLKANDVITENNKGIIKYSDGTEQSIREYIKEKTKEQTGYLYGIFQSEHLTSSLGISKSAGIGTPGESSVYKNIQVIKANSTSALISYDFQTTGLISLELLTMNQNNIKSYLPLFLGERKIFNKICTDPHYQTFGDYWYFFNPHKPSCTSWLKNNNLVSEVNIEFDNKDDKKEKTTYPNYKKIFADNKLDSWIFIGYNEEYENASQKLKIDDAYKSYVSLVAQFKKQGFEEGNSEKWFKYVVNDRVISKEEGITNHIILQKKVGSRLMNVHVVMTEPSIGNEDLTFTILWKQAMEKGEIITYAGHSGLGAHLDIRLLDEKLRQNGLNRIHYNKSKYQIMFFNGCSTYAYYNREYFKAKGGTKNLETINTGLPSFFSDGTRNILALHYPFFRNINMSYYDLIKLIESTNTTNGSTLLHVDGDE